MQLNRHNRVQGTLVDPDLASLRIGGTFRAQNIESFVPLLASDNELVLYRRAAEHVVLRRRE